MKRSTALLAIVAITIIGLITWWAVALTSYITDGGLARDLGRNVKQFEQSKEK